MTTGPTEKVIFSIDILISSISYPLFVVVAYFIALEIDWAKTVYGNTMQISFISLLILCMILFLFRVLILLCVNYFYKHINVSIIVRQYCKNHRLIFPFGLFFFAYLQPIEGNVLAFLYIPLTLIGSIIVFFILLKQNLSLLSGKQTSN